MTELNMQSITDSQHVHSELPYDVVNSLVYCNKVTIYI